MKRTHLISVLFAWTASLLSAGSALAQTQLPFHCISNVNATNCTIGRTQLTLLVGSPAAGQVIFTIANTGSQQSAVANVYVDDANPNLLTSLASVVNSPGVSFAAGGNPANLPSAGSAIPPFVTDFRAGAANPAPFNGVNPGESVGLIFNLVAGKTLTDVLQALGNSSLRVGIYVDAFALNSSESFVNDESANDNCPAVPNPNQADSDFDGIGDACDVCPSDPLNDADGDGICGNVDNCPNTYNPAQTDSDFDGLGDACDQCPGSNPGNADDDGDGICNLDDNCPTVPNPNQADSDLDGVGNVCDLCPLDPYDDADQDGLCADQDNCPNDYNPDQSNIDGDALGDICDALESPGSLVLSRVAIVPDLAQRNRGRASLRAILNTNDTEWNFQQAALAGDVSIEVVDNGVFHAVVPVTNCTLSLSKAINCNATTATGRIRVSFRPLRQGPFLYSVMVNATGIPALETGTTNPLRPVQVLVNEGPFVNRSDFIGVWPSCRPVGRSGRLDCSER